MKTKLSTYWRDLANGKRMEIFDRLLILFLAPLSWLYSFLQQLRVTLYQIGILKTHRLPRPVVSIGNIAVGGTGKTPTTIYIARLLIEQGYKVAVLSRGYGGSLEGQTVVVSDGVSIMLDSGECGDEPFLLASTVPGLMVVIGTNRYAAGLLAMQQLVPDIFLLDDGFQHLHLQRDLNILLLDCKRPFGNGFTLPVGLLREPPSAVRRADLIIRTRCLEAASIAPLNSNIPACVTYHHIVDLLPQGGGSSVPLTTPGNSKVLAFAGIADPASFFDELKNRGLNVIHTISFPDHSTYSESDFSTIMEAMQKHSADLAITTEKDGVKLHGLPDSFRSRIMLARLRLDFVNPAPLTEKLRNLLHK
jgi:tetraacyldisaccharide 4'-kinase